MKNPLSKVKELKSAPLSQAPFIGVVWLAHQALRARGFRWEVQRHGEVKLGLWRKEVRKKSLRKPFPKRFVFIPGFGDTPLSWITVLTLIEPVLKAQYDEIVLVDLPGYNGRLVAESLFPTVDSVIDSLFDVLDSLKPHTIVGHSLGGFFSAHYAAACSSGKRPTGKLEPYHELDSTVVIDPSGFFASDEDRQEWQQKLDRLVREGAPYWRPYIFNKEPIWFRFFGKQILRFISRAEVEPFVRSMKPEHELNSVLPEVRSRMTLIWGEKDSLLPPSLAKGWLKLLSNTREPARAVIIRNSGHSPQIEAPAKTAAVLGQILANRKPHSIGKVWYELFESEA